MLRPYVRRDLDAEQRGRLPLGQGLELPAAPQRRAAGELVDQAPPDAGLARQLLDVGFGGEESMGPPLDDEAVSYLGPDPATRPPRRFEHPDRLARPSQLHR